MHKPTLVIGNKNYSSWSLRTWFLLREMGIEFEELMLMLDTDDFEERIGDYSPSRRVPVLRDGGHIIWDTLSIAEYLNEKYPAKQLWPQETEARILARSVSAEMHSGFSALRRHMPMNCRAENRRAEMTHELQADIERVQDIWTECRTQYASQGPWLFGQFSITDAMYAPVAFRFATYGTALNNEAQTYSSYLLARPALQEWKQSSCQETTIIESEEVNLVK